MTEHARQSHLVERAALMLRDGAGSGFTVTDAPLLAGGTVGRSRSPEPAGADAVPRPSYAASPPSSSASLPQSLPPSRGLDATPAGIQPPPDGQPGVADALLELAVLERCGLAAWEGKRTRIAEEYSITAGNLLRAVRSAQKSSGGAVMHGGASPNVVMITSSKPDEGKSFSALNLAASLARNGLTRVVLADVDPKLGSLTSGLGVDDRLGLLDLAADPALKPENLVVQTALRDLVVMPLGSRHARRGDRGIVSQLIVGVDRLARRFGQHVIVLDAPPCLATSEPSALAPAVGVIVMVVEAERTQREEVEHALEMLKTCPTIIMLLNKVRGTVGHAFGDYDYYGA